MHKSPQPGPYSQTVLLDNIADFDEIIDVRTPAEYEIDHIPGAINAPVLSNAERVIIGTMYKQESAFKATKLGAVMVARNIARHLETIFIDKPHNWRPLVYCWRGGKRSGSMSSWLNLVGWRARQLHGGYKAWRHYVVEQLEQTPKNFNYIVLAGPTGSGKTRLLQALAQVGAQVLDLEELASHRGSLLGKLPDQEQPAQRGFETRLLQKLASFDPKLPVFTEAESKRIGLIHLPDSLLSTMYQGRCVKVQASFDKRIEFLLQDYDHLFNDKEDFKRVLQRLTSLHSKKTIGYWHGLIEQEQKAELFTELVKTHYDPAYNRSSKSHYKGLEQALSFSFDPVASNNKQQAQELLNLIA